ncbi:MAG: DCC1-like thiol-disulfide oxidoreductase family protein, partial [Gammaproteobacteria bacterium]
MQEVLFLIYFNHLIFDPIPFIDVEFPMITFFLWIWAAIAFALTIGYRCQAASIANYVFWLVFVNFTPMQRDFDGGFDLFMIGTNLFLIFMPQDKAFSIDQLRKKLATPFVHYSQHQSTSVSRLAYYLPVLVGLGFLYFDSAIHKMFAAHWRNGLGPWLPSSIPYYVSALNLSWLLNIEGLEKLIGYTIIVFQFTFLLLFNIRQLRPIYFLIGISLHLGIALSFNIYPFGLGMLSYYTLVMPFSWYRRIGIWLKRPQPILTVFYDQECPLCNRTVIILNHFDAFNAVDFKPAQTYARRYTAMSNIDDKTLLTDLYALDSENQIYAGIDTYAQIFIAMRYTALIGWMMKSSLLHPFLDRKYRRIADNRARLTCGATCGSNSTTKPSNTLYDRIFDVVSAKEQKRNAYKIGKILLVIILFQLNCSIHYGLLYRFKVDTRQSPIASVLTDMSNALLMFSHSFLGISPHALYVHDHFVGYNHLLAITYMGRDG